MVGDPPIVAVAAAARRQRGRERELTRKPVYGTRTFEHGQKRMMSKGQNKKKIVGEVEIKIKE